MKKITMFLLSVALAAVVSTSVFAQADGKRFQFAKGKTSVTVSGKLTTDGQMMYKVSAKKGQKLTVTFKSNAGKNAGIVIFAPNPDGEDKLVFGVDGLGSKTMQFDLEFTGDYEIQVGSTRGCRYTMTVKIT